MYFIAHLYKEKSRINFKITHEFLIVVTSEKRDEFWRDVVRKRNCYLSILLEFGGNESIYLKPNIFFLLLPKAKIFLRGEYRDRVSRRMLTFLFLSRVVQLPWNHFPPTRRTPGFLGILSMYMFFCKVIPMNFS